MKSLLWPEKVPKPFFINTGVIDKFVYFAHNVITKHGTEPTLQRIIEILRPHNVHHRRWQYI